MPLLDPKEEVIVAAYMQNGGNQTEAWKAGNPNSKAKAQSIHVQASKFFSQDKVRLRIAELHVKVEDKAADGILLTIEQHMRKLEELRDKADARGQLSAAIAAEVKRGELRRFYVKQVEAAVTTKTATELDDAELADIARGRSNGTAAPQNGSRKPDRVH
jgi:hypothetical protein